jgi:hypothetical protein
VIDMQRDRSRRRFIARVLLVTVALWAAAAQAAGVPPIDGHLTDPSHKLKATEKDSLEETLGKIQSDTQVDVAGWIMSEPTDEAAELGHEAYEHWRIGRDWENGVLFIFPVSGPALLMQRAERPALTESEVARVLAADVPSSPLAKRIERDASEVKAILMVGAKAPKMRPVGEGDPRRARWFDAGLALTVLLAVALTIVRRSRAGVAA